jgi:hypothetical protein
MNTLTEALLGVFSGPEPDDLIVLQEALLAFPVSGQEKARVWQKQALELAGQFYTFLIQIQAKTSARSYNELASWLDVGAVGLVAFQRLTNREEVGLSDILTGLLAEGLMVLASRQYVKAWDEEAALIPKQSAWLLRQSLWELSQEFQPDLPADTRRDTIQQALAPALDSAVSPEVQLVLLGRLYQALLQVRCYLLLATTSA